MGVPAIVAAGDRGAARAVRGESKAYLAVGERTLVADAVAVLQRVPEMTEVYVVGDAGRLAKVLGDDESLQRELVKPLTIVPQFRNLYENAWETYRRSLPGAGPGGRDPESAADFEHAVLYLSADMPFATAQEISAFVRQGARGRLRLRARSRDRGVDGGLLPGERASPASRWRTSTCARGASARATSTT